MRRIMRTEANCPKHHRITCKCAAQTQATAAARPVSIVR